MRRSPKKTLAPGFASYVATQRASRVAIAERAIERLDPARARSVLDVLRAYVQWKREHGGDAQTISSQVECWLAPALGHLAPEDCTPPRVGALVEVMTEAGKAVNTIRSSASTLKSAMSYAVAVGLIPSSPILTLRGIIPRKAPRSTYNAARQVLSLPMLGRIYASGYAIPFRERALYLTAAMHGLRFGEIAGLKVGDIVREPPNLAMLDDTDGEPTLAALHITRQWSRKRGREVPPKGGGSRVIAIRPDVLEGVFDEWIADGLPRLQGRRAEPEDLLFPEMREGRPEHLNDRTVLKRWHRHLKVLGLEKRTVHSFRHTFVSMLIDAGVRKDIAIQFTHPSPCATPSDVYAHYSWRVLSDAVMRVRLRLRQHTDQLAFDFPEEK